MNRFASVLTALALVSAPGVALAGKAARKTPPAAAADKAPDGGKEKKAAKSGKRAADRVKVESVKKSAR